jgi:hypothetical protein
MSYPDINNKRLIDVIKVNVDIQNSFSIHYILVCPYIVYNDEHKTLFGLYISNQIQYITHQSFFSLLSRLLQVQIEVIHGIISIPFLLHPIRSHCIMKKKKRKDKILFVLVH